jgi:flagellar hook-length control protein FliK
LAQFRDAIRTTEQSLNQQLFQQTSLRFQQELQQPIAFNLNIPYMEEQTVKSLLLRICQKSNEASTENQAWEIRLSFEFASLGLISTHILLNGDTLSSSFWADEECTKNKINDALPDFKQQLAKSGFNLGSFFCYLGQPPQESDDAFSPVPDSLLNIEV